MGTGLSGKIIEKLLIGKQRIFGVGIHTNKDRDTWKLELVDASEDQSKIG